MKLKGTVSQAAGPATRSHFLPDENRSAAPPVGISRSDTQGETCKLIDVQPWKDSITNVAINKEYFLGSPLDMYPRDASSEVEDTVQLPTARTRLDTKLNTRTHPERNPDGLNELFAPMNPSASSQTLTQYERSALISGNFQSSVASSRDEIREFPKIEKLPDSTAELGQRSLHSDGLHSFGSKDHEDGIFAETARSCPDNSRSTAENLDVGS